MSLKRKRNEENCSGEPSQEQQNMENKTVPKTLLDKLKLHNWVTFADLRFLHIYKNLFSENKTLEECAEEIIASMKGQLANMYIWVTSCDFDIIDNYRHLQEIFIKLITSYMFYVLEHKQTTEIRCLFNNSRELYVKLTDSAMIDGISMFFAGPLQLELVSENGEIFYKATLRDEMRIDETFKFVISNDSSNPPIFLGGGSYGFAFKVMGLDGMWYVVKVFDDNHSAEQEWASLSIFSGKHECLQNGIARRTNQSGYLHHYIVSAFQGQVALSNFKKQGVKRITLGAILKEFIKIVPALDIMHNRGFIHGDIKPDNIVRFDGKMVLIDFGLTTPDGATIGPNSLFTWWFRNISLMLAEMMMKEFNTMISIIVHPIKASFKMDYWAFFMTILKTLSQQSSGFIFDGMTEDEAREMLYHSSTVIWLMKKLKRYFTEDRGIDFIQEVYFVLFNQKGSEEMIRVFNRFKIDIEPSFVEAIYREYLPMFKEMYINNPMRELVSKVFKHLVYSDPRINELVEELRVLFVEIICDGADLSLLGLFTKSKIDEWLIRFNEITTKFGKLPPVFFY
jgi:serine/threonine protein kinase